MSIVLIGAGVVGAFIFGLAKAIATDEIKGRINRRARRSVEASIATMTLEQQEQWGEELLGDLAAYSSMPWSAMTHARNVRKFAIELTGEAALVPAGSADLPKNAARPDPQLISTLEVLRRWIKTPLRAVIRWLNTPIGRSPLPRGRRILIAGSAGLAPWLLVALGLTPLIAVPTAILVAVSLLVLNGRR